MLMLGELELGKGGCRADSCANRSSSVYGYIHSEPLKPLQVLAVACIANLSVFRGLASRMRHLALLSVGRNPFFVFSTTRMKTFAVVNLDASNAY